MELSRRLESNLGERIRALYEVSALQSPPARQIRKTRPYIEGVGIIDFDAGTGSAGAP